MQGDALFRYADLTREAVDWIIPGLVPRGMLTVLAGQQGLGKSLLYCAWAATLAAAGTASILVNAEDSSTHSTKPRLEALRADDSLIMGTSLSPEFGNGHSDKWYQEIGEWILATNAGMLVLDPLAAFIASDADVYRDHHVRRILEPLSFVAAETNCGIIYIKHERKDSQGEPLSRISDSVAFTAGARSVVQMKREGEYSSRVRLVCHTKCNVAELAPIERWEVVPTLLTGDGRPEVRTARLESRGVAEGITVWDVFAPPVSDEELSERERAETLIRSYLAVSDVPSKDLMSMLDENGISEKTAKRARSDMGVTVEKRGRVWWSLSLLQSKGVIGEGGQGGDPLDSSLNHAGLEPPAEGRGSISEDDPLPAQGLLQSPVEDWPW